METSWIGEVVWPKLPIIHISAPFWDWFCQIIHATLQGRRILDVCEWVYRLYLVIAYSSNGL